MFNPKNIMIKLRTSFWFIPLITVLASMGLAAILIEVDSQSSYEWRQHWPRLFGVGADGAREMLSTIAGSIMTMIGVTFSMTLVTLALASSQYSSRVLRSFIRNRLTQSALGLFASIFTYCLIVLRTIRGGETPFIPSLSIFVGFILALVGLCVLVLFIHHVATSIQASTIISSVAKETETVISNLFPDDLGSGSEELGSPEQPGKNAQSILSERSGYIQTIDEIAFCELSQKTNSRVWLNYGIGDFVVKGSALFYFESKEVVGKKSLNYLKNAFSIQNSRTIEQDAMFGIRQIVDIALKALSPGVNDTTTAVLCIDYLTSILARIVNKKILLAAREIESGLTIIVKRPQFSDFLNEAFSQIRTSGRNNFVIQKRLIWSYETLSHLTTNPHRKWLFKVELGKVQEVILETFELQSEKKELERDSSFI